MIIMMTMILFYDHHTLSELRVFITYPDVCFLSADTPLDHSVIIYYTMICFIDFLSIDFPVILGVLHSPHLLYQELLVIDKLYGM